MSRASLRVVGGSARGRRLQVPKGDRVRPTPDRVRETLFNWLQGEIAGAVVLDLFAGSGALGIESLSRGAARVVFVENDTAALAALRANLARIDAADAIQVCHASAWSYLETSSVQPFDLVWLDPPYGRGWAERAARALEIGGWLQERAWVYVETGLAEGTPAVPSHWEEHRRGRCGEVVYRLYFRSVG